MLIGAGSVALDFSVSNQECGLAMEQLAALIDCIFRCAYCLQCTSKMSCALRLFVRFHTRT